MLNWKRIVDRAHQLPLINVHQPEERINHVSGISGLETAAGAEELE